MTNSFTKFHTTVAQNASTVSPLLQRHMYDIAVEAGDSTTIVALLGRSDLAEGVEADAAKLSAVNVVAAWCARPSRTTKELEIRLKKEKRVAVLETVAQHNGLSDELYMLLAGRDNIKIASALFANIAAPHAARAAAAATLCVSAPKMSFMKRNALRATLRNNPEFADMFATTSARDLLETAIDTNRMSPNVASELVRTLGSRFSVSLVSAASKSSAYSALGMGPFALLVVLAKYDLTPEVCEEMCDMLAPLQADLSDQHHRWLGALPNASVRTSLLSGVVMLHSLFRNNATTGALIATLTTTTSATVLRETFDSTKHLDAAVVARFAKTALANPAADCSLLDELSKYLTASEFDEITEHHLGDLEFMVSACVLFKACSDPRLEEICEGVGVSAQELWKLLFDAFVTRTEWPYVVRLLSSEYADTAAATLLPFNVLTVLHIPQRHLVCAALFVEEELGENPTAMAHFTMLAPNHNGSLQTLTTTALNLSKLNRQPAAS